MALLGLLEIFLAIICFLLVYYLPKKTCLPRNYPVFGMLPDLLRNVHRVHDWGTEVLSQTNYSFMFYGPWFCDMDILVTVDPVNIHYIMSSNFSNFPKGIHFKKIFDILGDGIFNSDLELWKNQRKLALKLMTHYSFYQFLIKTTKDKVDNGLMQVLNHVEGKIVDLQDIFQRFTFDATCMLVTGYDPNSLSINFPGVPFSKAMDDAEEAIFYRHVVPERIWKLMRFLNIGEERKLSEAWKVLDQILSQIVESKKQQIVTKSLNQEHNIHGVDLLTSYITEAETMGVKITDKFLRDTIINFMLAGRDTTSSALSWFFYLIAKHPEAKSKIRKELKQNWTQLTNIEELKKLVYVHGAICETLRLHPPVPFEHKAPMKEDTLPSGHKVSPNMKILFSLYTMGRLESIWGQDCLEFKPERWISETSGIIKHQPSYKFMAFNAGPRTCLGKEVAFTQMKAVVAAVMCNYDFEVVEEEKVSPCLSIILHMKHGLKVRFKKRS